MDRLRQEDFNIGGGLGRVRGSGEDGPEAVIHDWLARAAGEDQDGDERHDCAGGKEEIVEEGQGLGRFGAGGWIGQRLCGGAKEERGFGRQGLGLRKLGWQGYPPGFGEGGGDRGGRWCDWLGDDFGRARGGFGEWACCHRSVLDGR
jgi:hypothetical protein